MELYIIATPIGNRKDITIRALKRLFQLEVLACEDTRNTRSLLLFYQKEFKEFLGDTQLPRLVSYFEHNAKERASELINLIKDGVSVGLVSNAGTPTISDPGFNLVNLCLENNIKVKTLPGASAVISALSISGFSADKFLFLGFLPRKHGKQSKVWEDVKKSEIEKTVVFYESPYRIAKTLENIKEVLGDIDICIARELTKVFEEVKTMKISEWEEKLAKEKIKGELVVLFRK